MRFSFPTETIVEGISEIVVPRLDSLSQSDLAPSKAPVFYNPTMELNRDLAVLALQTFQRTVRRALEVCEPLAGCGIRGVRLAKEVDGVQTVIVNDLNPKAVQLAKLNVTRNDLSSKIIVKNEDANLLLSGLAAPFRRIDYVDVDPFGSPVPYVDTAFRSLRRGGMLAITATDLAPLCGVHPRACIRKYCAMPLRTEYCHELAIRLLAGALARQAAKFDVSNNFILSYRSEHYVRLYSVVNHGAKKANESLRNIGYIHHCFKCLHREIAKKMFPCEVKECPTCGNKMSFAGPLWIGKINSKEHISSMMEEAKKKVFGDKKKLNRLLVALRNEADAPITYYVLDRLCDKLGLPIPSINKVVAALKKSGFMVCLAHFKPNAFKSNASVEVVKRAITSFH